MLSDNARRWLTAAIGDIYIADEVADAIDAPPAASVTVEDTGGNFAASDVEGVLAELAGAAPTPIVLTPGAEVFGDIPVVVTGSPADAIYDAQLYEDGTMEAAGVLGWLLTSTGPVSDESLPHVICQADAGGALTIVVTNVLGAPGVSVWLRLLPLGGAKAGAAVLVSFP